MVKDKKFLSVALSLFLILVIAYSNHFENSFHFDDFHTIVNNVAIKKLSNIPSFFYDPGTFSASVNHRGIRPVVSTTLAIDYAMGNGLIPFWFHLSTFLWHIGLCIILFLLFRKLLSNLFEPNLVKYIALFGAAWFGIHTAVAETINYVISRSDVLSTYFILLSLYLYVAYPAKRKSYLYIIPAVIGVLAKETVFVLVILLFFYEVLFEEDMSLKDLFRKTNFKRVLRVIGRLLPVFIAILIVQVYTLSRIAGQSASYGMPNPIGYYWLTQSYVWFLYFKSFFLPIHLSADTDLHVITTIWDTRIFTGVVFVILLLIIVFKTSVHKKTRPIAFGILWFAGSLLPTSLAPFAEVMNDHRMYFAFTGLSLSVVTTCALILERRWAVPNITKARKRLLFAFAFLVIGANAYGVFQRNKVWRTEETLWYDVTQKSPGNGRGLMNYGLTQLSKGNPIVALDYFQRAQQLLPTYNLIYVNLGIASSALVKNIEAEQYFKIAIQLAPNEAASYSYYAQFLANLGKAEEANTMADKALGFYPFDDVALDAKMSALQSLQRWDELNAVANKKLNSYPGDPTAIEFLAKAKIKEPAVIDTSRLKVTNTPKTADEYLNLSLVFYNAGKFSECIEAAENAIRLNPNSADAYSNICAAYNNLQQWDKAKMACAKALTIDPTHRLAKGNMQWALTGKMP